MHWHWQVDEIIHGCCPLQIQRCLMFKMTDGVQTVYGIELKPIEALQVCAPRGLKVSSMPRDILFI
jgi:RecQ-mediated genome instability protein 1